jgi:murein DD-endopeptidase MepM/ murein hydrolase activator NlpD
METGGKSAFWPGEVDYAHTNNSDSVTPSLIGNYFSIDFSYRHALPNGTRIEVESDRIPVLAAADGWVVEVNNEPKVQNGCYVVIDHDNDQNSGTGYTTRYLHLLKESVMMLPTITPRNGSVPPVGRPIYVHQGDVIGYMGNTGEYPPGHKYAGQPTSFGKHLHFGVRYNGEGFSTKSELQIVKLDGLHMKQYQTEGSASVRHINSFFVSGNTSRPLNYVFPVIGQGSW